MTMFFPNATSGLALETGGNLDTIDGKMSNASADGVLANTQLIALGASDTTQIRRLRVTIGDQNDGTHLLSIMPYGFDTINNNYNQLRGTPGGNLLTTPVNNNASVPTGAGNTVIKSAMGVIGNVVVTTAGTGSGNVQIFDNSSTNSGTVLFAFPATASAGTTYQFVGWAKNGMTAQNVANGPVFTVFYS